jgi:serine/threonine protein kinase
MAPDGVLQKVVASLKSVGEFDLTAISVTPKSSVYKAVEKKIRRALVIKLMPLSSWGTNRAQISVMAGAERRIVKGFDFPGIPRLLTGGEVDDHLFWITEFVDGIPLNKTLENGETLSALDLVDMARQLCTCVESTGKSGAVHHRFHPHNLIVEWDGGVKILDWSVPPYSDLASGASAHTLHAAHYLAPEKLAGKLGDFRSNLFSVGVILYQLATAKLPFAGETVAAIAAAMSAGNPPSPSQLNSRIPEGISVPILKTLSANPKDRYQSASELIKDLENYKKFGAKEELPANFYSRSAPTPNQNLPARGSSAADVTMELDSAWTPAVTVARSSDVAVMSMQDSTVAVAERPSVPAPAPVEPPPTITETVYTEPEAKPVAPAKAKIPLPKIKPPKITMRDVNRVVSKIPPLPAALVLAGLVVALLVWKIIVPYMITKDLPPTTVVEQQAPVQQAPAVTPPVEETPPPVVEPQPAEPEVVVRSFDKSDAKIVRKGKKKSAPVAAPVVPTVGELSVNSEPQGAAFQIDGRSDGSFVTPTTVAQLSPGRHVITFSKTGYQSQSLTADIVAGSRATMMTRLAVQGGTLNIGSKPTGASIVIDGRDTGKLTPAQFILQRGQHSVVFRLAGYLEASVPVNIADGQNHTIAPELVAMGRTLDIKATKKGLFGIGNRVDKDMGTVNIRTNPNGAAVLVNGQLAPKSTPLEFRLNPGGYEITFQLRGYKTLKKVIVVESGSKMMLNENLEVEQ